MTFRRLPTGAAFGPLAVLALLTGPADAQRAPTVDSIHIETRNVFDADEAASSILFRLTNGLHITTQAFVVRREVLFAAGEPYDSALVAETERNLRSLAIFRDVTIDSVRVGGRLIVRVVTSDGWTTSLNLNARSTGDVFTWSAGLTERNVLGTANMLGVAFFNEVDRDVVRLEGSINRAFGTRAIAQGFFDNRSDGGGIGRWVVGVPFRALQDRQSFAYGGEVATHRVLRFRTDAGVPDTTFLWRSAFVSRASVGIAPVATPLGYVRVGLVGQVRREAFVPFADRQLPIPDSVTGAVGAFLEVFRSRFLVVTHFNGFAREEDVSISTGVRLAARLAPAAFGYERTGIAPAVTAQTGAGAERLFARLQATAHGLFTSQGLDSGQVRASLTVASRVIPRQATILHVQAGAKEAPVPGAEFDLGHGFGIRSFKPHAFTGTRTLWGILEHRTFLVDDLLGVLALGVAGFLDYGGAWYPDQPARFGGNAGAGLRLGTTRSTGPNVGRFDLAYQFGDGAGLDRWVFSFGQSFAF